MTTRLTETDTGPAEVTEVTEPAGDDPETVIAQGRAEIDALDAEIVRLVRARVAVSERVQRVRLANGGRRVHLARENEVLRRWREELGQPGTALAMTLLELSRGRV
ncbi:chorismate mutase [Streptomyces profundus]|uniref:chorismate mutase n=1 Tax=Streptomyces profundus TaxID=2867410 RepID=UPI001D161A61|nr:chorismate mutase [Streptomyces sp. MA3_2.13]UED84573.1 chorismate mutase [Streptomyces sp. MA3_2.13]